MVGQNLQQGHADLDRLYALASIRVFFFFCHGQGL
jgi:hypothetical protein